jgi:hypothetical protein
MSSATLVQWRQVGSASKDGWVVSRYGVLIGKYASQKNGPVESASRWRRCWHVCARCRRNYNDLQAIIRSGSKLIRTSVRPVDACVDV